MKASIRELSALELDFVSAGTGYTPHRPEKRDDDDRDHHKPHGDHKHADKDHDDDKDRKHRYC